MRIWGITINHHDGAVCLIEDGKLQFSIEAEKDTGQRGGSYTLDEATFVMKRKGIKEGDIISCDSHEFTNNVQYNYFGCNEANIKEEEYNFDDRFTGRMMSVPHEFAHIVGAFGLSPHPMGTEFVCLLWEGGIGKFYYVDKDFYVQPIGLTEDILDHVAFRPGMRHASPLTELGRCHWHSASGKVMALAGLSMKTTNDMDADMKYLVETIITANINETIHGWGDERAFDSPGHLVMRYELTSRFEDMESTDPRFADMCKFLQDSIYDHFMKFFIKEGIQHKGLPLIVTGGCGLNCSWNTRFKESGMFSDVFVAPITNDSGMAVSTAIAAQYSLTGDAKVEWDVYSGEEFVEDTVVPPQFEERDLDVDFLCQWMLDHNEVVAWVQGKYEIGPRALGHRSLIAPPFDAAIQDKLNQIKHRESYRPVAPMCLLEDVSEHFDWQGESPYMLHFQNVTNPNLKAVTHADGTARLQTVDSSDHTTYNLLQTFKKVSGTGVLCNTSLNFLAKGFINRTSDLVQYAESAHLNAFVINDRMYFRV